MIFKSCFKIGLGFLKKIKFKSKIKNKNFFFRNQNQNFFKKKIQNKIKKFKFLKILMLKTILKSLKIYKFSNLYIKKLN